MSAMGHVWTAPPWQELSELLQHWSGAVMCPACLCGGEVPCRTSRRFAFSSSRLPADTNSLLGASISIAPAVATTGYLQIVIRSRQREGLPWRNFTGDIA
jgi:hypothetical protein